MKSKFSYIYLLLICFTIESQAVYTRHKYEGFDYQNHLSKFFQIINDRFSKNLYEEVSLNLVDTFMNSHFSDREEESPFKFYFDSSDQGSSSDSETNEGTPRENRIAQCSFYEDSSLQNVVQKFYMPLRDAEVFAMNFEKSMEKAFPQDRPFKVLNLNNKDTSDMTDAFKKVVLKCTAVDANDVTDSCKACMYFEEVVLKSHFRYGHVVDCGVMECMNGFDKRLASSQNKGYFFLDFVKFHPLCIA